MEGFIDLFDNVSMRQSTTTKKRLIKRGTKADDIDSRLHRAGLNPKDFDDDNNYYNYQDDHKRIRYHHDNNIHSSDEDFIDDRRYLNKTDFYKDPIDEVEINDEYDIIVQNEIEAFSASSLMDRNTIRGNLNIEDQEHAFEAALVKLSNVIMNENGQFIYDWKSFLNDDYIKNHLFSPIYVIMSSFDRGQMRESIDDLWKKTWNEQVEYSIINSSERFELISSNMPLKCCLCGKTREPTHKVILKFDETIKSAFGIKGVPGYLGSECYKYKFLKMIELINICKRVAETISIGINLDMKSMKQLIISAVHNVSAGNEKMRILYEEKTKQ